MSDWRHPPTLAAGQVTRLRKPRQDEGRVSVLTRRVVSNLPIRVPSYDWAAVVTGQKRMFRAYAGGRDRAFPVVPPDTECPRPCLLFSARHNGPRRAREWEAAPGVLLAHRQEPLGAITPEDLAAEGFEFLPAFKWYWKQRYKKLGWRPWDMISVIEVRPLAADDPFGPKWAAEWLFQQLYAEWLRS